MAKPTLSAAVIRQAVSEFHSGIEAWAQLVEGEVSQAFAFRADGRDLVVRVNTRVEGFQRDAFASAQVATESIPVPEVVHIDRLDEQHWFCVTARADGAIIQNCDTAALTALAEPVAAVMAAIGSCDVSKISGFGSFDPLTGRASHTSWSDAIAEAADRDWRPHEEHMDAAVLRSCVDELRDRAGSLPDIHRLVHGDFGNNNLLVEDGLVTAVLDWEAAMIGDDLYDVATQLFWAPWLECAQVQAGHALADADSQTWDRLRCYLLQVGLNAVDFFVKVGQAGIARAMLTRISPPYLDRVPPFSVPNT